ncbi:MAG: hypothetical protein JO343_04975, partial [Candidatus Eremiobacteraeota bacterium]|nr:hypothetical protein [Candidatus Eremiobacteraeota bacterium]
PAALVSLLILGMVAILAACTAAAPPSIVSHNGAPVGQAPQSPVFNQTVIFVVKIPPVPASAKSAVTARKSLTAAPTPVPSTLYLSPHTGSIAITLVAVNGVALSAPAPAVPAANVPGSCSPAGCSITISGVPAAIGVDLFAVSTWTGPSATGSIISNGVVDVPVPTTTTQSIGSGSSTTLTIGGYVASISLSVTPTTYTEGKAAKGSLVASAKDATGATIIGNAQFANPIVVSITIGSGTPHFSFAGGSFTYQVTGPLSSPVPIYYDGSASLATTVSATSVNGNGGAVNATPVALTVALVLPSPSPTPTTSPTIRPHGVSLYVLNGMNNAVEEFPSPAPAATPKREFGPTLAMLDCAPGAPAYAIGMVQGVAVDDSGNGYVTNNSLCGSAALSLTAWQWGPAATATSKPSSTFVVPAAETAAASQNLGFDPTTQLVLLPTTDTALGTPSVLRLSFPGPAGSLSSILGGGPCFPLVGFSACDGVNQFGFVNTYAVAVDSKGYSYLSGLTDLSGNPAIAVFSPGATTPIAYSAIDGPQSDTELDTFPAALAIDGTTLYVLDSGNGVGYSNCGPIDSTTNTCADGFNHEYVTAYDTAKLVAGSAVDLKPTFVLGGDAVGRFGSTAVSGLPQGYANRMTVYKGTLYVANTSGPVCNPTCNGNATSGVAPPPGELDVYNVSGLKGDHNDVAPASVISPAGLLPAGVAIGASGTASGPAIPAIRGVPGKYRGHLGRRVQLIH